ncbi:hypothetical protein Q5P01_000228 [Channa striata]|uniref:Uncharacterized protein n=1 Tax=Channa striata TaxID=64152 RepID=A0AA88IQR5_CHASR|nr:hypothetical protein Q5P01_000228 [Channa striata]
MSDASFWGNRKDDRDFLKMQARHSRKTHARGGPAGLLGGDDAARSPRYERFDQSGQVHARMVALCLATEDYARSFLVILKTVNPCLFEDLVERGPQGKMVRKEPPRWMHLTAKVKSVLRSKAWRRTCYISVS